VKIQGTQHVHRGADNPGSGALAETQGPDAWYMKIPIGEVEITALLN
jgi:hypothetical protein